MSVWALFAVIVLVGLVVALIQRYAPIDPAFKTMVLVVGIVVCVAFILYAFGLLPWNVQVPKLR